jgi:ATP-binding cassette subfamily B protein
MLVGAAVLVGVHWPVMGLVVSGSALIYLVAIVMLSLVYVAPAARLGNAWDTKLGGALATVSGGVQGIMPVLIRLAIVGVALLLWRNQRATAGDIAFVLTLFFILQGYLREVGMHVRNLQRSINDMEELVALEHQSPDVADSPNAVPIVITAGEIRFDHVTFLHGGHDAVLAQSLSMRNGLSGFKPGERRARVPFTCPSIVGSKKFGACRDKAKMTRHGIDAIAFR